MSAGIETWQVWETPSGEQVQIRHEGRQPPLVRGSEEAKAEVRELLHKFDEPEDKFGILPKIWNHITEGLTAAGWTLTGHSRRENLASAHLQAAVRQAEQSSIEDLRADVLRVEGEGDTKKRFINAILAASASDRAREASRNAVVLATAALEAFINEASLEVSVWGEQEDGMRIQSKWIVVTALLTGGPTFNRGAEPFQSFQKLVKLRNRIVHAKPTERFFEGKQSLVPALLGGSALDVDLGDGRIACVTARRMILEFCRLTGQPKPGWVAYVPPGRPDDLEAWSKANILTGLREDPDFPKV